MKAVPISIFILLSSAPFVVSAQNSKDEARQLFTQAGAESDMLKRVQLECRAAELDHKTSEYSKACNTERKDIIKNDEDSLQKARAAFEAKDYARAAILVGYVSSVNSKLADQAKDLLGKIRASQNGSPLIVKKDVPPTTAAPDQSAALLQQAKAAWDRGAFDDVRKDSQAITDPAAKETASHLLLDIDRYNGYFSQAQKLESSDPQKARTQYDLARQLNANGPGSPAAHVQQLDQVLNKLAANVPPTHVDSTHPDMGTTPVPPKGVTPNDLVPVKSMLAEAARAESEGRLQEALSQYGSVLRIQGGNEEALAGRARTQELISHDSQQLNKTLTDGIRAFYDSKFSDAKVALEFYLNTPQARSRGAAAFYLGAVLAAQSVFDTPRGKKAPAAPPAALAALRQARTLGYKPVAKYISPSLMKLWETTAS